jgi:hypothetical protein
VLGSDTGSGARALTTGTTPRFHPFASGSGIFSSRGTPTPAITPFSPQSTKRRPRLSAHSVSPPRELQPYEPQAVTSDEIPQLYRHRIALHDLRISSPRPTGAYEQPAIQAFPSRNRPPHSYDSSSPPCPASCCDTAPSSSLSTQRTTLVAIIACPVELPFSASHRH